VKQAACGHGNGGERYADLDDTGRKAEDAVSSIDPHHRPDGQCSLKRRGHEPASSAGKLNAQIPTASMASGDRNVERVQQPGQDAIDHRCLVIR
jgi:hypothetical protein